MSVFSRIPAFDISNDAKWNERKQTKDWDSSNRFCILRKYTFQVFYLLLSLTNFVNGKWQPSHSRKLFCLLIFFLQNASSLIKNKNQRTPKVNFCKLVASDWFPHIGSSPLIHQYFSSTKMKYIFKSPSLWALHFFPFFFLSGFSILLIIWCL